MNRTGHMRFALAACALTGVAVLLAGCLSQPTSPTPVPSMRSRLTTYRMPGPYNDSNGEVIALASTMRGVVFVRGIHLQGIGLNGVYATRLLPSACPINIETRVITLTVNVAGLICGTSLYRIEDASEHLRLRLLLNVPGTSPLQSAAFGETHEIWFTTAESVGVVRERRVRLFMLPRKFVPGLVQFGGNKAWVLERDGASIARLDDTPSGGTLHSMSLPTTSTCASLLPMEDVPSAKFGVTASGDIAIARAGSIVIMSPDGSIKRAIQVACTSQIGVFGNSAWFTGPISPGPSLALYVVDVRDPKKVVTVLASRIAPWYVPVAYGHCGWWLADSFWAIAVRVRPADPSLIGPC